MRESSQNKPLGLFVDRCGSAMKSMYIAMMGSFDEIDPARACTESAQHIVRMLATIITDEQMPEDSSTKSTIRSAAQALHEAAVRPANHLNCTYRESCRKAYDTSRYGIFALGDDSLLTDRTFSSAARLLLRPLPDAPIDSIFFQTMPLSWLGCAYQGLLALRPTKDAAWLEYGSARRKDAGIYFTPPSLANYIIDSVVMPLVDTPLDITTGKDTHFIRVLDPAMGGGDFLSSAIERLSVSGNRAQIAAECVYGVDIDPTAVEISRFCVWAASRFSDQIAEQISSHLVCADALGAGSSDKKRFDWHKTFRQVFAESAGFDAVVGNPPYIAAKNGLSYASSRGGQSDTYLLFLNSAMENGLVRPGGMLSMVLPDPMLVRENAAEIRQVLMSHWDMQSLLHISGVFRDAQVANIVPVCRNVWPTGKHFPVCRIERQADRRTFALRPKQTFHALAHYLRREVVLSQKRCEFLYLLEDGRFGEVIRRIHGENAALDEYQPPFVPLRDLNIKAVYRGEEVGKSAIGQETGDLPVILGGQSIKPYEILWEGLNTNRSWVKKSIERYHSTKIVLQKSSARLIAALDSVSAEHIGYVFPQSVYGIEIRKPGIDEVYLLCILNSEVMNEYIWRTVTGYKFVQPQIELEDIRALPVRQINFTTPIRDRESEVARGIELFNNESSHGSTFPELSNFVAGCIAASPERSDIVHDVLVHFGRLVIELIEIGRKHPSPEITRRLESARAAVETVVCRLYSSEPTQMNLPI